ncbi:hypothetical protein [Arthrobacter bambusae]|uniref:Uncharacterized protein n=1 Tax=Arthrobacter bambusae TaxID=1338426 RepID=A0AAW8DN35_9MICC|nr:hypothetical protein [Arthrobacter bambusae]MDP9907785.1 hypothetical protein [Arthrobacter bambusae]MDQ0130595.1 hypothetical protein [Arthrobacter bambusae]MDQ0181984.1 hypothetical protein [Arthrobacter bambusae]
MPVPVARPGHGKPNTCTVTLSLHGLRGTTGSRDRGPRAGACDAVAIIDDVTRARADRSGPDAGSHRDAGSDTGRHAAKGNRTFARHVSHPCTFLHNRKGIWLRRPWRDRRQARKPRR